MKRQIIEDLLTLYINNRQDSDLLLHNSKQIKYWSKEKSEMIEQAAKHNLECIAIAKQLKGLNLSKYFLKEYSVG